MWITILTILILFFCLPVKIKIKLKNNKLETKIYILYNILVFKNSSKVFKEEDYFDKINKLKNKNSNKSFKNKILKKDIIILLSKIKIKKLDIKFYDILYYLNHDYLASIYVVNTIITTFYIFIANIFNNIDAQKINIQLPLINNKTNIFKIESIFEFRLVNIIYIIFKILVKRGREYVRTSYRKFNDNSNEVFRKYD